MSAIQKVTPYIDRFQTVIRHEKESHHLTIEQLSELSGVPYSVVGRISSGAHPDPKLINAAALCDVLGLSLDELCGLSEPVQPNEELMQRIHDLEIENAELRGADRAHLESMTAQKPIIYSLLVFFALSFIMAAVLFLYIIGDAAHPTIGLIQGGELSGPAWAIVILLIASVSNAVMLMSRLYKYRKG